MEEKEIIKLIEKHIKEEYFFIKRSNISRFIGGFVATVVLILGISLSSVLITMRKTTVKAMVSNIKKLEHKADTLVTRISEEYYKLDSIDKITVPIGTIISYAGDLDAINTSEKWMICDGRPLDRITYSDLFSAIKVYWGMGDGIHTFNLPDLRGQFLRGVDEEGLIDKGYQDRVDTEGDIVGPIVGSFEMHSISLPEIKKTITTYKLTKADRAWGGDGTGKNSISFPNSGWTGYLGTGDGSHTENGIKFLQAESRHSIKISHNFNGETRPNNIYVNFIIKVK